MLTIDCVSAPVRLLSWAIARQSLLALALLLAPAIPAGASELGSSGSSVPARSDLLETAAGFEPVVTTLAEATVGPAAEFSDDAAAPVFRVSDLETALQTDGTAAPTTASDLAQVTRVTDFADVVPSDWAFQALSNLVENYGCIQGYPDRTFRGQRSLTRYEFAAGLNACLDVLVGGLGSLSDEDLQVIRSLQEEFAAELITLQGRVDTLEAETAQLRAQQFSTQTKLRGQVFMHLGGGFANGPILAERNSTAAFPGSIQFIPPRRVGGVPDVATISTNPGTTVGSLAWINMDTSFTGSDRLKLQLVAGGGIAPANFYGSAGLFNTFGTPFTFQTGSTAPFDVSIRELSYLFPVGDNLTIDVGARINWYSYFDNNRYTFFLTGANSFNSSGGTQVNTVDRGSGAIAVWNVTDWMDVRLGYLAESTEFLPGQRDAGNPQRGLFGGTSTLSGQIGLRPFDNLNLRFLYTRSNLMPNAAGQIGGTLSEPIYGFADNGVGGALTNAPADTFLFNFDWTPTTWLGLFGRYSYGSTKLTDAATRVRIGDINAQSFQIGVAFPNLFKEGSLATVSYLVPFDVTGGRQFLVSGGGDGGTQQELEFSYRYPVNRNIAIMPSAYWIMNANNFGSNPDIFIFNLQTQISF